MSKQQIALAATLALIAASCDRERSINVMEGSPFSKSVGELYISFDGKDTIEARRGGRSLLISARAPSTIHFSPSLERAALNYGNGSGQVLDIEIIEFDQMKPDSGQQFKDAILGRAKLAKCDINPDEISYIVENWVGSDKIKVRTENWSRRIDCPVLNRTWDIDVTNGYVQ